MTAEPTGYCGEIWRKSRTRTERMRIDWDMFVRVPQKELSTVWSHPTPCYWLELSKSGYWLPAHSVSLWPTQSLSLTTAFLNTKFVPYKINNVSGYKSKSSAILRSRSVTPPSSLCQYLLTLSKHLLASSVLTLWYALCVDSRPLTNTVVRTPMRSR